MAANVFVSYDHDDQRQVGAFKLLKHNPNHPLDFQDHSLKDAILGSSGKPLTYPPTDARSKPVRDAIKKKFERASKLVVLIGADTHNSDWVDWEIKTFHTMKEDISGDKTWKRIRGMNLKGSDGATVPTALGGRSTKVLAWDPETLDKWLDLDPDA
jgi:hypothetical protein